MSSANRLVQRVATSSAVLGAAASIALGVMYGPRSALSSAVGSALGVLNLWVLARLVSLILDENVAPRRRTRAAILLGAKALALITAVGFLIIGEWVRGGSLMAGLSVVAVSIVLAAARSDRDDSQGT
jgi:hypothetical protein